MHFDPTAAILAMRLTRERFGSERLDSPAGAEIPRTHLNGGHLGHGRRAVRVRLSHLFHRDGEPTRPAGNRTEKE